jgi:hypothetical protein
MKQLFSSPLGSWLKAFLAVAFTIFLSQYTTNGEICFSKKCITDLLMGALVSTAPILINWLNPEYKGYGKTE